MKTPEIKTTEMKTIGVYIGLPINHPESLIDLHMPIPDPVGRDLLVKIEAIAVNPADIRVRGRITKNSSATVLGWGASGVVEKAGPLVSEFTPGDEVFYAGDLSRPGCNSEYHLVDARIVGKKPQSSQFFVSYLMPLLSINSLCRDTIC